jgi:hypothetical protein
MSIPMAIAGSAGPVVNGDGEGLGDGGIWIVSHDYFTFRLRMRSASARGSVTE